MKERSDDAFDADRVAAPGGYTWVKEREVKERGDDAFDADRVAAPGGYTWVKEREA